VSDLKDAFKHTMPFGKFKGKTLKHIMGKEPGYFDFLLGITIKEPHKKHIAVVAEFIKEDADDDDDGVSEN